MEKEEILKMLFNEHHRHLSEIKQKIQSQSQRTIGILALATGWLILSQSSLPPNLRYIIAAALLLICGSTLFALYNFNKKYRIESKIVSKINHDLKLFSKGVFLEQESVYPESWKCFGEEPAYQGLVHHFLTIIVMTILSIISAFIK